jgi:hypothetical protein
VGIRLSFSYQLLKDATRPKKKRRNSLVSGESYKGAPEDGRAWLIQNENENRYRVLRGGSFGYNPAYCRSAYRYWFNPDNDFNNIGVRVACAAARTQYPHFSQRKRSRKLKALLSLDLTSIEARLSQQQCVLRI